MSASDANSAIYVTDSAKEIKTKVCPAIKFVFLAGKISDYPF
jgi:tryptophanyl-tRNA synthetase